MQLPIFVEKLIELLERAGYEAWAVGGCVRDAFLEKEPQDYDICTNAHPEDVKRIMAEKRVVDTGIAHGTVTVWINGQAIEVTTYRAESGYRDGRRPDSVRYLTQVAQDLSRRDFTINAMAYHPQRGLKDPFGGQQDLRSGIIRCVGMPARRFQEDGLRLVRALRFAAQLDFQIEPLTAAALCAEKKRLRAVSAERVSAELCKLLTGPGAGKVLQQWPQVFGVVLPEILPAVGFLQYSKYHHLDVWEHTAASVNAAAPVLPVRLALLFHDLGKPQTFTRDADGAGHFYGHAEGSAELAEKALERLRLPVKLKNEVVLLVRLHDRPVEASPRAVRRILGKYGEKVFFQLLEVKKGDAAACAERFAPCRLQELLELETLARRVLKEKPCLLLKDMAVNGDDLKSQGFTPGPVMGCVLNMLLEQVMDGTLENNRETLLQAARGLDLGPESGYTETRAKE